MAGWEAETGDAPETRGPATLIQPRTTKDSASNKMETLKTVSFDLHVHTDHTVVRRVVRTAKV